MFVQMWTYKKLDSANVRVASGNGIQFNYLQPHA